MYASWLIIIEIPTLNYTKSYMLVLVEVKLIELMKSFSLEKFTCFFLSHFF